MITQIFFLILPPPLSLSLALSPPSLPDFISFLRPCARAGASTQTEWMGREQLAELLYGKYLITIPIVFDLFSVYGRSNRDILRHLISALFSVEPSYQRDLTESLRYLVTSFDATRASIGESDPSTFDDLAVYIMDCGHTINTLLAILSDSDAVHRICGETRLAQHVTRFYDDDIPNLVKTIELIAPLSDSLRLLKLARYELLRFFRCLIDKCMTDVMQSTYVNANAFSGKCDFMFDGRFMTVSLLFLCSDEGGKHAAAETLLTYLQEALADQGFVIDYQRLFPVEDDIDILKQWCPALYVSSQRHFFLVAFFVCVSISADNYAAQKRHNSTLSLFCACFYRLIVAKHRS